MMELYGAGHSRWAKCYWMLKELGKDFQECPVNFMEGELRSPKFLALNPFGKMPVLKDGDVTLFESTAILNYLGEKFPESGLTPKGGTVERAYYDQWNSYCTTELEQPLWRITKHTVILPEAYRIPADVELAKKDFAYNAKIMDQQLGTKKYLVGDRFTAADITLAYTLGWAIELKLLTPYANLLRYTKETHSRPAFPEHLFGK